MTQQTLDLDEMTAALAAEDAALAAEIEALQDEWLRSLELDGYQCDDLRSGGQMAAGDSTPTVLDLLIGHGFPRELAEHLVSIADTFAAERRHSPTSEGRRSSPAVPSEGAGVPGALCDLVDPLSDAPVRTDAALTAAADASVVVSRWLDGHLVTLAQEMNVAAGRELLARLGVASPDELGKTKRAQWRVDSKAAVANELRLLTGKSLQTCHDLVGFALTPPAAIAPARAAMASGQADWQMAQTWYDKCRNLPHQEAAAIASRLFCTPSDPEPNEPGQRARTSMAQFKRNLKREIARVQGNDPAAQRAKRKKARAERAMSMTVDDDGTATISLRGPTSAVVGSYDRIDVIARKARAGGEEGTIRQLAVDAALALLAHGKLSNDGSSAGCTCTSGSGTSTRSSGTSGSQDVVAKDQFQDAGDEPLVDPLTLAQIIAGLGPVHLDVIVPLDALLNPDSTAVGEIANHGVFLTAEHVRELALSPGTTLHRLLTDPGTGVCVERSRRAYAPDRDMREQIAAVDRLCRAPGCTVPASRCQFDHVEPYDHDDEDHGGPTAIKNLATEHGADHSYKTRGLIEALLEPETRKMTWRTLFGRIYATYPHDYRQYSQPPWPAILDHPDGPNLNDVDVRDRLIYAALTERTVFYDEKLAGWDDFEDAQQFLDMGWPFEAPHQMFHHTPGGAPRRGPDKTHPSTDELLHLHEPTRDEREAQRKEAKRRADDDQPPPF